MLVDYSSSSEEEDHEVDNIPTVTHQISHENGSHSLTSNHRNRIMSQPLPSVPSDIVNMFGSNTARNTVDDPQQHAGRIRSFAHERGNWATHVYIPYQQQTELDTFVAGLLECLDHNWLPVDDLHISLSRTFPIRYHWIEGLYTSLQKSLASQRRFSVAFCGYKIYTNDEGTRSFLGVNVQEGHQTLLDLVGRVDKCLEEYRLPVYYSEPEFHLSLVWCLGDARTTLSEDQHGKLEEYLSGSLDDLRFIAQHALMKTGNRTYNLPFT